MNPRRRVRGSKLGGFASFAALEIVFFGGVLLALNAPAPQGSSKLAITTKSLPNATVGVEYYAVIAATGGEPPYDCSGTGLPPNLAFHYTSDTIGGKATTPGTYSVVITVTDSADPPHTSAATYKLTVLAAK
jgi:Putative Ig domain